MNRADVNGDGYVDYDDGDLKWYDLLDAQPIWEPLDANVGDAVGVTVADGTGDGSEGVATAHRRG